MNLTFEMLESAAYLCLETSATMDLNAPPPFTPTRFSRGLVHKRKKRFQEAGVKLRSGAGVCELGLTVEDLAWARARAERAKNPAEWERAFAAAEEELAGHLDLEALRRCREVTYRLSHNPNVRPGREYEVRMVGSEAGAIDGKPPDQSKDAIAYGQYFHQAANAALRLHKRE